MPHQFSSPYWQTLTLFTVLAWDYVKANVPAVAARYPTSRPENWQVKKLLDLPVVNELVDNPHRRANSAPFALGDASNTSLVNKNLIAVLSQVTGTPDPACNKCCRQHGLWVGCVRAPTIGNAPLIAGGACANCAYNGRTRACQTTSQPAVILPAPQFVQPAQPSLHNHGATNAGGNEEEEDDTVVGVEDEQMQSPGPSLSPGLFPEDDGG